MSEVLSDDQRISGKDIEVEEKTTSTVTATVVRTKKRFDENEDVLSRWNDGLLYLGTIIKVDDLNEKCLVRFEDNSEHWALFKDLQKGVTQGSEIVCSLCENGASDPPNEIVICDNCSFGFHQLCHNPSIPSEVLQPEVPWLCRQCAIMVTKKGSVKKNKAGLQSPKSFPYELGSLTWDTHHRSNEQQCYCYCGGPGDSALKMLQCYKCKQWFHEACIQSLDMPLLYGDRFYVFVCSVCNSGSEFLRRLELKWADVVHLVIYNLTINHNKKYFDFQTVIIPYINDNWDLLQLSKKMAEASEEERYVRVQTTLLNYRSRFKCGREIKKKNTIWGLRLRVPPAAPKMFSPLHELDSGHVFNDIKMIENKKIKQEEEEDEDRKPLSLTKMRKRRREADLLMEAVPMVTPKKENCLQPLPLPRGRRKGSKRGRPKKGRPRKIFQTKTVQPNKNTYNDISKVRKMQMPYIDSSNRVKCSKNANVNQNGKSYPRTTCNYPVSYDSSDDEDASSHGTLDSIIPPPTNFEGHNNPFRNLDLLPFSVSVLRPGKRKLNSNDIRISKKGEIKQRRYRRRRIEANSGTNEVTTTVTNDCGHTNDFSHLMLNGQLSEGSADTSTSEFDCISTETLQMNTIHSPKISLNDLKSSVNSYFGAANRIASGEKFNVLARRITPEARVQYLIEWEGLTA